MGGAGMAATGALAGVPAVPVIITALIFLYLYWLSKR